MKANQKYFPLLDAAGKLANKFPGGEQHQPEDTSFVTGGSERVVRPRLADARFFFDQDRKKTLASRVGGPRQGGLSQQSWAHRASAWSDVRAIAKAIASQLGDSAALVADADQAALLAKTDLVTDMVGEFPELQGIAGRLLRPERRSRAETVANASKTTTSPALRAMRCPRNTAACGGGPGRQARNPGRHVRRWQPALRATATRLRCAASCAGRDPHAGRKDLRPDCQGSWRRRRHEAPIPALLAGKINRRIVWLLLCRLHPLTASPG